MYTNNITMNKTQSTKHDKVLQRLKWQVMSKKAAKEIEKRCVRTIENPKDITIRIL